MKRLWFILIVSALGVVFAVHAGGPPVVGDFTKVAGNDSTFYLNNAYAVYLVDPTSGDTLRALILSGSVYVAYADTSDARLKSLINARVQTWPGNVSAAGYDITGLNEMYFTGASNLRPAAGSPLAIRLDSTASYFQVVSPTGFIQVNRDLSTNWYFVQDSLKIYTGKTGVIGGPITWAGNAIDSSKITNGTLRLAKLHQSGATTGQIPKWNGSAWAPAADATGGGTGDSALYLALVAGSSTNLRFHSDRNLWVHWAAGSYADSAILGGWDTTGGSPQFYIEGPGDTTRAYLLKADTLIMGGQKIWDPDGTHLSVTSGVLNVDIEGIGLSFEGTSIAYGIANFNLTDSNTTVATPFKYADAAPNARSLMKWVDSTFLKDEGTDTIYSALVVQSPGSINMSNRSLINPLDPADATGVGDRGYNDARYLMQDGSQTMDADLNMNNENIDGCDTLNVAVILSSLFDLYDGRYIYDRRGGDSISTFVGAGLVITQTDPGPPPIMTLGIDYTQSPTWTGGHDFGGASGLEVPNGANPTTNAVGEFAYDSDDSALEVYDGTRSALIPIARTAKFTIYSPGDVNDTVTIPVEDAVTAPHGITIVGITIGVNDTVGTYALEFEEWTETSSDRARAGYIDTLNILNNAYKETSTVFTDASIAAGNEIRIIIPSTAKDELWGVIRYYVNEGN